MPDRNDLSFLQDSEFAEPTETRARKTLESVAGGQPASMTLGAVNKISQARIRYALAELTGMNLEKVSAWLDSLAKDSPKAAIDALIELLKFTTPQQKSVSVETLPTDTTNYGNLTLKQLQGLVFQQSNGDGVVSEQ